MTNSQRIDGVRQILRDWYARVHGGSPESMEESILIRDGYYCGRRFRSSDFSAVWFAEEQQVKIYSGDGALLETVSDHNLTQAPIRRAA